MKMADVTALCAQTWSRLTDKQKYETKAIDDKNEYDKKLLVYKALVLSNQCEDQPAVMIESDDSLSEEY
jgi:hypothetical protein